MPKLSINLADDFKATDLTREQKQMIALSAADINGGEWPRPHPVDRQQVLSRRALFWVAVLLATGCALVAITGADKAHGAEMHVNKPKPLPVAPYCGTTNGIAVSDDATACAIDPEYPAPRYTISGYVCPTQYHVAGRKGALRCDEET